MSRFMQHHYREKRLLIAFILLLGIVSWLFPEPASALRKTSANRECSICHIMWLDEFKREDVTPLIPFDPLPVEKTGKQDVASTERMCFSCHDGFVLDSRFLWKKNRHNHPVGVIPTDDVTIPTAKGKTVFPLNEDGKLYCGTCHTAHAQDWDAGNTTIFLRLDNRNSNICTACHLNRVDGLEKGNHPIQKKLKELPPSLLKAGSKFNEDNEVICESCHIAHGSEQIKMLAKPNQNSDLCASCHVEKAKVRNTKHNMSVMAPTSKNTRDRVVTEFGPCSACHIPHKARGTVLLWSRPISVEKDQGSAYCLSCHKAGGIAREKTIDANSHPVNVPIKKVGIIADKGAWISTVNNKAAPKNIVKLPLFDKRGKRMQQGGNVTCISCHDPHQWSPDHGQQPGADGSDIRKIEGDGSNSFLRIANTNDSALCTNCHRAQATVAYSRHNLGITASKEKNRDGMNVSRSGVCSACHLPHNGESTKLWARNVANNSVTAKCNGCHAKGEIAKDKTTGKNSHPLQVILENIGATTDLPLFNNDGERDDKGQVDCATCHDPHQWDSENVVAKSGTKPRIDGNTSNSFLRLKANGNSALCINCHKKQKNVIGTDHDLSVTAGKAINNSKKTVKQSGVCGQCHTVHNSDTSQGLWARGLGEGKHDAEKRCTSCHSLQGVAAKKVPIELTHPPRILVSGEGRLRVDDTRKIKPPLFAPDGGSGEVGTISCSTCHDPHQWDASKAEPGSGKNLEGDTRTSFLRHSGTEYFICSDCHAEDSLYRYKYFHGPKSRAGTDIDKL